MAEATGPRRSLRLPQAGDIAIDDETYEALLPMDGWAKGSRGGPRPYWLTHDGKRYVVVVSFSDFGDVIVMLVMETNPDACSRCQGSIEPGTSHSPFNGNQMFACTITVDRPPKKDDVVDLDDCR